MKSIIAYINEKLVLNKNTKTKYNDTSDLIHNIVEVLYNGLDLKSTDLGYYGPRRPKNYLYCDDLPYEQFEEFIDIIKDNKQIYDINDDEDDIIKVSINTNSDISITFNIDTNNKEIYKISFSRDLLELIKNYLNINY